MEDTLRINVTCVVELDTMRTNVEINKITANKYCPIWLLNQTLQSYSNHRKLNNRYTIVTNNNKII